VFKSDIFILYSNITIDFVILCSCALESLVLLVIITRAVKRLIAINHIQNKSLCLHNRLYVGGLCIIILYI